MDQSNPPLVVAVVEDDAPSRTAPGRLFRAAGFEPVLFESAEARVDPSPAPTCNVVDVQLPGVSGIEPQQQRLRAAGHAPRVIVTTSRHETVIQERAQENGCAAFSGSRSTAKP